MYIHEHDNWPHFRWDNDKIAIALDKACRALGMLYGRLSNLGFDDKLRAIAENLTLDVVQSSEIEGIHLNSEDVRSSIARRLGIDSIKQNDSSSHYIDGVVNVKIKGKLRSKSTSYSSQTKKNPGRKRRRFKNPKI